MPDKVNEDFKKRLNRLDNRPQHRIRRGIARRTPVVDFCHLVRKHTRQASQTKQVMELVANRFTSSDEIDLAFEAVKYMFDEQPKFATYNRSFGFALATLAHRGFAPQVLEMLKQSVRDYPENIAANASIAETFEALITNGHGSKVAKLFSKLSVQAPEILASTTSTGQVISDLIKAGQVAEAVNAFFVIGKRHPGSFSSNETLDNAIDEIGKLKLDKIFGDSKAQAIQTMCASLHERSIARTPLL